MKINYNLPILFVIMSLSMMSISIANAQPLEDVNINILENNETSVSVNLSWNHDATVFSYEAGCVSCIPNITKTVFDDAIILDGITAFANGNALLYVIAYDENSEIIDAKQIMAKLN